MTRKSLVPLAILASSIAAFAAPNDASPATKSLQGYPKNLARHHLGANLFLFNASLQQYATTEAAAAWLDDDVTTGWPVMAGKQHYLLVFPEPEVFANFAISARQAQGTVSIYAGDEPAEPGAKTWTALAKNVPFESINEQKLGKGFNRLAKYLLIETDIADPGPLFSLYVYGDRPAVSYILTKRDQAIDTKSVLGYVNDQTAISHSGLYVGARVTHVSGTEGFAAAQRAIDENPESSVRIAPSTDEAGMVLNFDGHQEIARVAVLTGAPAEGSLDFFLVPAADGTGATSLAGLTPAATMQFDGSSTRQAVDLPGGSGGALLVRWTPASGNAALTIRELNAFNALSLSEYTLGQTPEAVAELASDRSKDGKTFADGKTLGDGKGMPEEVGELLSRRSPYLPGALGFPPNITGRIPPPLPPEVSP